MWIQFDELRIYPWLLFGAILFQVVHEVLPTAGPVKPKDLAENKIGFKIEPNKYKRKEQYKDILRAQDMSAYASTRSPQIKRVIH